MLRQLAAGSRPESNASGPMEDELGPSTVVPVRSLRPADSPRVDGERAEHARLLAEVSGRLPPVIVHRSTMRIIDGMHRLRAAQMRGDETITVRFFDGTVEDAFVVAVHANVIHGMPLSMADREAATVRILMSHPTWSNRAVAAVTGLAATTVAAIRRRRADLAPASIARVGRDGRVRPLDPTEGRRKAMAILAARPGASLREIARAAGISAATVRDVRERMHRGDDPLPSRQRQRQTATRDREAILRNLRHDPALRFTDRGRELLRWLDARSQGPAGWEGVLNGLPAHSAYGVAELARWCAQRWLEVAEQMSELTDASRQDQPTSA
jgi:ParB-like chromosome segregation protein Spo0J